MVQASLTSDTLKQAMKEALIETLNEEHDLFRDLIAEALEDIALMEAIKEGEQSEKIDRDQVFEVLEDRL